MSLQPYNSRRPARPVPGGTTVSRQTARQLARLQHQTVVRRAGVIAETLVQTEKLHAIDDLAREGMTGHALLRRWADTLAAGDPLLGDELRFFLDTSRYGKGEILAETISTFCQESRR